MKNRPARWGTKVFFLECTHEGHLARPYMRVTAWCPGPWHVDSNSFFLRVFEGDEMPESDNVSRELATAVFANNSPGGQLRFKKKKSISYSTGIHQDRPRCSPELQRTIACHLVGGDSLQECEVGGLLVHHTGFTAIHQG